MLCVSNNGQFKKNSTTHFKRLYIMINSRSWVHISNLGVCSPFIKPGGCCINIWLSHSFFKWIKPITCDKVYLCTAYIQSVQKWYIVSQSSFALQQLNVTLTRGKIDFQFKNTLHPKAVKLKKRLDSKDLLRLSQADTLPSASQS